MQKIELHKQDMFPSPLFWCDAELPADLQQKIIKDIMSYEEVCRGNYRGEGFTTYGTIDNFLNLESCREIKSYINDTVNKIHSTVKFRGSAKVSSSWASVGRRYSSHSPHNHLPNLWSGVYYVKAESNCAPIQFIDRNRDNNWPWDFKTEDNEIASQTLIVQPKTGCLLIFPGYVQHGVLEQKDSDDRITIAFNCFGELENHR